MKSSGSDGSMERPSGFLVVDKPSGITSRTAVDRAVRLLPSRLKVGHAGTLDPLASGVLVLCIGKATRLVDAVQNLSKSYRAVMRLGATSDTLDADGQIVAHPDPRIPSEQEIGAALAQFSGDILQKPPDYSAVKVAGRRAYDIARSGAFPTLEPRTVQVYRFELMQYAWPRLEVEVDCGKGTYIRSLAGDLGMSLGCGAYIEVLVRTRIGPFRIEEAIRLDDLSRDRVLEQIRPEIDALTELARITLDADEVIAIAAGKRLVHRTAIERVVDPAPVALLDATGRLVALAEYDAQGYLQPRKVFC